MFVFLIKDKGIVIDTLPIPLATTSDQAWKIASMALADYPDDCEVLLEERND
jgi:hypothetical protein